MTKEIKLKAKERDAKESLKTLRNNNLIPAVIYNLGKEAKSLVLNRAEFDKAFSNAGESSLLDLSVGGGDPEKVIIKEVQHDIKKGTVNHVDFYRVDMTKKISAMVPINLIGEAPAVKEHGGILLKGNDHVEIECLPGDLLNHIDIDLSVLKNIHDSINVSDLKLDEKITILSDSSTNLANITEKKIVVEEETAEEKSDEEKAEDKPEEDAGDKKESASK